MERYKTRNGIVLTEINGEHLLVSARALRSLCPYVTIINETTAFLWDCLKNGATADELVEAAAAEYEVEDMTELQGTISSFLHKMMEYNYLVPITSNADENPNGVAEMHGNEELGGAD